MGSRSTRDLGLARVRTVTRWMAVGALVGGGVLSVVVSKALPGHSSRVSTGGSAVPTVNQTPTTAGSQPPVGSATTAPATSPSSAATVPPSSVAPPTDSGSTGGSSSDSGAASGGLSAPAQAPQPVQTAPVVTSGGS
jgi:hypothetical protein